MKLSYRLLYERYLLTVGQMRLLAENSFSVRGCKTKSAPVKSADRGTKIVKTRSSNAIQQAANLLGSGHVIALPTDTVYGLACSANNHEAIKKLYEIKGRNETKPIAICVPDVSDVLYWGQAEHLPKRLLQKLLPGAVTIVVYKSKHLNNPYLNPGLRKIGIRVPKFDFIRGVSKAFKAPVALTSANRSSQPSTLNVNEFEPLWNDLGKVFDGGQLGLLEEQRAASTVIDLSEPKKFKVIRKGVAIAHTISVLKRYDFEEVTEETEHVGLAVECNGTYGRKE